VLDRHGSVTATTRGASYRESGWSAFDPDAPAYTADQVREERTRYAEPARF